MTKEEVDDSADLIGMTGNPSERLPSVDVWPHLDRPCGTCTNGVMLQETLDGTLRPVVMQLRSHLESMESNAAQVAGISDALCATTAVLDGALFNCLDRSAYVHR